MGLLTRKTAIVTGASSGIGESIAKQLAEAGANVVLVARRSEKLEAVVGQIAEAGMGQAFAIQADVSERKAIVRAVETTLKRFGRIDILVNNAGLMLSADVRSGGVEGWEQMIDVNIKGMLYGIDAVLPGMIEQTNGHIVNIGSVAGVEVTKRSTVYSATKFAVKAISAGLEKELAQTGVRVTNITPGMVDTPLSTTKTERKKLAARDIGNAVVYATTQPDYVNVNEITVRPV